MSKHSKDIQKYYDTNQSLWNQKTPIHLQSEMYDMENFLQGKTSLKEIELHALPNVKEKSMLHLQCHFGQDALSWARMGAKVTAVDLSDVAIKKAKVLNQQLGLDVNFIQANIYDLPNLLDEEFDIVFTSYGVLCWLHDLTEWAKIISQFLKQGGTFFIVETHPMLHMFDTNANKMCYGYFNQKDPIEEFEMGTYTDFDADIQHKEYSWNHSLSETISPLLQQGLAMLEFKEYNWFPYNCYPNMTEVKTGRFVYNAKGVSLPHMFSLKMEKV